MRERKQINIFTEGPITAAFIADSIQKHSSKTEIGAHNIFLGQVRADEINGKKIVAIEYTAYPEMALKKMHEIREAIFEKYQLTCMHVHQRIKAELPVWGKELFEDQTHQWKQNS